MNAGEFRCLLLSLRCYRSAESSLDVLADEFRDMASKTSLVDPRFPSWVVQAGLDLFRNATQFESITTLDRFEHLTGGNAEKPLLGVYGDVFQKKTYTPIRVSSLAGNFLHRRPV